MGVSSYTIRASPKAKQSGGTFYPNVSKIINIYRKQQQINSASEYYVSLLLYNPLVVYQKKHCSNPTEGWMEVLAQKGKDGHVCE